MIALLIVGYIAGAVLCAYIFGRLEGAEFSPFALVWPAFALVAIIVGPLWLVGALGERHS